MQCIIFAFIVSLYENSRNIMIIIDMHTEIVVLRYLEQVHFTLMIL